MPWKGKPFGWGTPDPYLGYLPEPQDASVNLMMQLTEGLETGEFSDGGEIEISLNYLEPPSIELALQLQLAAYNSPTKVVRKVETVPKPDPRKSGVKFKLWKYSFKKATPAVAAPPPQLAQAIANLASQPYDYQASWQRAGQLAGQLQHGHVPEVLAVMVYPPPIQDAIPAWVWLPQVQLSAAQVVAQIEKANGIMVGDSALRDICLGPIDWTIDAAAIALVQRAREETYLGPGVAEVFEAALDRLPREGYWSCLETILHNWLLLPDLPPEHQAEIEQLLAAVTADE